MQKSWALVAACAVLAVIFRFSPDFPQNVLLLKSVSVAAMLGVGPLTYYYFTEYRPVPWQLAVWRCRSRRRRSGCSISPRGGSSG